MRHLTLILVLALCWMTPGQTAVQSWYADGQVWVVWDDASGGMADYEIYASPTDLSTAGTTAGATLVGRMLPPDYTAGLLRNGNASARYRIPDGAGGTYVVNTPTQGVFAYTPLAAGSLSFAVVITGSTTVTAANSSPVVAFNYDPINDPVRVHLQDLRTTSMGQTIRVFAHWIHGAAPSVIARPDYPIMGSASFNGCAHVFAVTEPTTGPAATPAPLVCAFHGGGGSWWGFTPDQAPELGMHFSDAYHVAFDQNVTTLMGVTTTAWLGYREDLDRYANPLPSQVPLGTVIGDYTHRRVMWELDWVQAAFPIDPARTSIVSHSAGSRGSGFYARLHPERFAAINHHCPHLEPPVTTPLFGDRGDNLMTTLGYGVADIFTRTTRLSPSERDLPFTRMFSGRLDTVGIASWDAQQVQAYRDLDATGHGYHLFWDMRTHAVSSFPGAYWGPSTYCSATSLTQHRNDVSYPGIHEFDADVTTPGRQPDPGDGTLATGTNAGTWGGWVDWDGATITDTASDWECDLFLVTSSPNVIDNYPLGTPATCDVTIRRPQSFQPLQGEGLLWDAVRLADGVVVQTGSIVVGAEDLVEITGLRLLAEPGIRLRIRRCNPAYVGTGEDLVLRTGVNGPANECTVKPAQPFDLVTLEAISPSGSFDGATLVVYAQTFTSGTPAPSTPGLTGVWIDLLAPHYAIFDGLSAPFGGGLAPGGFAFGPVVLDPTLAGQSVMLQAGVITPTAANGLYAATDGHEIRVL